MDDVMWRQFFQQKFSAHLLLLVFFAIIYFFVGSISDPTQKKIANNPLFETKSAYLMAPLDQSINELLLLSDQFTLLKLKDIPWSFEQHAYWLKITIENHQDSLADLVSHFDNAMLDQLSIFQIGPLGKVVNQQQGGDVEKPLAFKQRILPHFHFTIAPNASTTLYVRIATTGIAHTPIHIYEENDFMILAQKEHLLWGVFIGVAIIIGLYNLVLYFSAKDIVYLLYNGYILSCVAFMGILLGYGFYLFPENIQLSFNRYMIPINCLMAIFTQLFLIFFLKFQVLKKWHYWLVIKSLIGNLALLFISLYIPEYQSTPIFFFVLPIIYIICIVLLFSKVRIGMQWGKYYFYSWFPLLLGTGIQPLVLSGDIEYNFISQHALMVAILIQMVLMAMALADRIGFQKNKALYDATHELNSGLPNKIQLERKIASLLKSKRPFAACLIEITNYPSLAPYISHDKLQKLESQIVKDSASLLSQEANVSIICDFNDKQSRIAKVRDGHLMFIFESTDRALLSGFLSRIQENIAKELQIEGLLIALNTKIGICFNLQSGPYYSATELVQYALLAITQNRKNDDQLHYYHDLQVHNMQEHLSLACDLQVAIQDDKLALYHQPQIDLHKGNIAGSEVLLRWNHPEHGFISPELFIAIAENTGLINELTRWVIDKAFQQVRILRKHQYLDYTVSINISGKDIILPNFFSYVKHKMLEYDIPANVIIFELTESVMVSDFKALHHLMVALKNIGINISIDDYGTGYSSLTYISQLQFDELKIDKAFILDLDRSDRNATIVQTTIEMAKHLNLIVVAEGVESAAIETKLIANHCDIGQGYYYSKPLEFNEYLDWARHYQNEKQTTPESLVSITQSVRVPAHQLKQS